MSKARKLLTISTLKALEHLTELGVPVATAMRRLDIEGKITRPTVVFLLAAYRHHKHDTVLKSLDPDWLDGEGASVQEQPENYNYVGYFPQGHWIASDKGSDACKA